MKGSHQTSQKKYPAISWLAESWLKKVIPYERIVMVSPRLDTVVTDRTAELSLISSLPSTESPADLILVANKDGEHIGRRIKVRTWPLLKLEM